MSIVSYASEGNIATITMDDGKVNALSPLLLEELFAALDRAEQERAVVVLSGREGIFSGGFDLRVIGQGNEASLALARAGSQLMQRLLTFPTPVLAASPGHAIAMGIFVLLSCDYRIGIAGDFRYGLNEVAIGMTLPYSGIELAAERLSRRHFSRAVNNAEMFSPAAAVEVGYLDTVVEPDAFAAAVQAQARQLSALNMDAHRQTKSKSRESLLAKLDIAMERDFESFKTLFGLS